MILRAIDGAMFAGHTALIIKNSDGQGVYFSFAQKNNRAIGKGEMSIDVLNKQQMDKFLKDGEMNYICNSTGTVESQKYSTFTEIPISNEQGASMIGKGIGYFHNPGLYVIVGKQCDVVVQNILNQGDVGYKATWFPNQSFSNYRDENELDEKTIKGLDEVILDKIPSNVKKSIQGCWNDKKVCFAEFNADSCDGRNSFGYNSIFHLRILCFVTMGVDNGADCCCACVFFNNSCSLCI